MLECAGIFKGVLLFCTDVENLLTIIDFEISKTSDVPLIYLYSATIVYLNKNTREQIEREYF